MPRYDYECLSCGHLFELRQSFDSDPEGVCPQCEGKSRRKFHPVPIIYKGSGFYTTDYKHTGFSDTSKEEEKGSSKDFKEKKEEKDSSKEKSTATKSSTDSSKNKSEAAKKEA